MCEVGYKLRDDNRTCKSKSPYNTYRDDYNTRTTCRPNCDTINKIEGRLDQLEEKVSAATVTCCIIKIKKVLNLQIISRITKMLMYLLYQKLLLFGTQNLPTKLH